MNTYLEQRRTRAAQERTFRRLCLHCLQPDWSCYCKWIQPFDCGVDFAILIHPLEFKKRIATGRMAHLSLHGSRLLMGQDYSNDPRVNELVNDPERQCLVLYPGRNSVNLTNMTTEGRRKVSAPGKRLTIFVIDGSWSTARKIMRLSQNVKSLPRVCFTPTSPSNFRIRRQPRLDCYSTIEAIHHTIELFETPAALSRDHDRLLDLFNRMVDRQIELTHSLAAY